ncbi:hypothetical protein [Sphingobacterium hungaricum]|uniref:Uncharacterized protein n=1 Tax=Sphingobacterium hungaricum TaxID=2082723 RepID=A0A928UV91_9SPHI|nr:hypothetical protein [Sphingobacterium hungaricum]MBE8712503.1 hypothetical protein [Sphingobacterium hungaricum]
MTSKKNLLIQKSLIPLDWNPKDPNGYNEWMAMIVEQNLKSEGVLLPQMKINISFRTNEPLKVGEIIRKMVSKDLQQFDIVIEEANKLLNNQ